VVCMSTIDGEKRRGNHLNIFADKELELREALSTSVVQSDVDCQESVDSPVIRGFPSNLNSFDSCHFTSLSNSL